MATTLELNKVGLSVEVIVNGGTGILRTRDGAKADYTYNRSVQTCAMTGLDGTDSFKITYNSSTPSESAIITRGTNYDAAGIKAAIEAIAGFSGTVTVADVTDAGFTVTISGITTPAAFTITSATGCSGVFTNPNDSVLITIDRTAYTYNIGQVTMNASVLTNYSDLKTQWATTFG
jgi:hypothetical protein